MILEGELRYVVDIIVRDFNPDKIILYGSRARGDYKDESDYDLLVLMDDVQHRRKKAQEIEKHLYPVPTSTDIIVDTPKRFKELSKKKFLVYQQIAKDGITIYEH